MKALVALLLLMGCASVSLADNDKGLYLGAGIGYFSLKSKQIAPAAPTSIQFDGNDTSFKAFAGWRFNKLLAVELDYIDLGKPGQDFVGTHVEARINGAAPYLKGTLPLGPLELYAKAGYMFYDLKIEASGQEVSSRSKNQDDVIAAVGLGLTLLGHLNATLEYEYIDISQASRSDAVWLTGAWRF
ncbi:MAG TPA: outer membrane beta-barrel protein [Steroidobacteraceae bacterium]|nr:outer membrane beta-barrel protein [Steroidobacteraceae bacterium]